MCSMSSPRHKLYKQITNDLLQWFLEASETNIQQLFPPLTAMKDDGSSYKIETCRSSVNWYDVLRTGMRADKALSSGEKICSQNLLIIEQM